MHEKEYLELLIRSLKKKLLILNKLAILNQDQRDILQDENADPDTFEINVRDKEDLVKEITALDAGFGITIGAVALAGAAVIAVRKKSRNK